jgi:hypothetical protein
MAGVLKSTNDKFIVEYADRGICVQWLPGETINAEKPMRWIKEALPRQEQVPESMLRSLIGSEARFSDTPRFEERKVELQGKLDDGGTIAIVYFKGIPAQVLSESDRADAAVKLQQWAHSYLRSDISRDSTGNR